MPIQALLTPRNHPPTPTPAETAADLVNTVTTSSDPAHALWELWDAFFIAVVTSSTSHDPHLALLDALHAHPPTQLNVRARSNTSSYIEADGRLHWKKLPRFSAQWRDVHDILEAWRDWDGVRDSGADNYNITALLKATRGKDNVHPIWVFFACRDALGRDGPQSRSAKAHRMSSEQLWALDVHVAATWMRDGGRALWKADYEELRYWAAALDDKTELWLRGGLTRERWILWGKRLRAFSIQGILEEETVAVVIDAADVVSGILEDST
ncbi:unnamed protein product [Penicillium discolor]